MKIILPLIANTQFSMAYDDALSNVLPEPEFIAAMRIINQSWRDSHLTSRCGCLTVLFLIPCLCLGCVYVGWRQDRQETRLLSTIAALNDEHYGRGSGVLFSYMSRTDQIPLPHVVLTLRDR